MVLDEVEVIAIPGTGSGKRPNDWDKPDSPLFRYVRPYGIRQLYEHEPNKRYAWSGALDGLDDYDGDWDAFARYLFHYIVPPHGMRPAIPPEQTYLWTHSHAGNIVMIACGKYGLKVEGLITVGMPIRGGRMEPIYAAAAQNIQRHVHLHAGWRDYWQVLGALFDGRWGIHRKFPDPRTKNFRMPKGHGNVLREPELFHHWIDDGWLQAFLGKELRRVELT